jgi:hypothetical protein
MADDLLEKLSEGRLPAVPDRDTEPQEPTERTEVIESGRRPEDVVSRERWPSETQPEETTIPAASKKRQREVKTYEIDGRLYSKEQLEEAGLIDRALQTARQYEPLRQKYLRAMEEQQAVPQAAPAEVPQIRNVDIARVYDSVSDTITQDLLDGGLAEEDFVLSWPRTTKVPCRQNFR